MNLSKAPAGRRWRVLGTLAVAVALLGALGTTPASAATVHGDTSAVSALGALPASPNSCPIIRFGYGGEYVCGTAPLDIMPGTVNDSGSAESFVLGTDWAIWHAWPGSNGWHSLGGQSIHALNVGNQPTGVFEWSGNPFAIWVFGTDSKQWCDNWGIPAWMGWHLCKLHSGNSRYPSRIAPRCTWRGAISSGR
jgi:hypothetical protein